MFVTFFVVHDRQNSRSVARFQNLRMPITFSALNLRCSCNLVPRAHVPFGQHQDSLGADQKARGLWERDCCS